MMRTERLAREQAESLILRAWKSAADDGLLAGALPLMPAAEFSDDGTRGDLTSAFCLAAAPAAGMEPRALARLLAGRMGDKGIYLSSAEAAGPGYLNFRLSDRWYRESLSLAAEAGSRRSRPESRYPSPIPDPGKDWGASLRRRIIAQALDNVLERAGACFICIDDEDDYVNRSELVPGPTRLLKNGREAGGDVPPADLPLDALRFLLCTRLDRPVTVDLDVAARSDRANPYYRVRYARDRINRVLRRLADGEQPVCPAGVELSAPTDGESRSLIRMLSRWDELTAAAARTADPGLIPDYLLALADRFWKQRRALLPPVGSAPADPARTLLCSTVLAVLEDGLRLLGIAV
jgi:arginyl-tRNA synthetase